MHMNISLLYIICFNYGSVFKWFKLVIGLYFTNISDAKLLSYELLEMLSTLKFSFPFLSPSP